MSGQKNENDASWMLLLIIALVVFFGWLLWHFFKVQILEALRWLRFIELWPLSLVFPQYDPCVHWLTHAKFADPSPSQDMINWTNSCFTVDYIKTTPPEETATYYTLAMPPLKMIERGVISVLHWPLALVFAFFGYHIYFLSWRNKFRTKHNLESFIQTQARMWPVINPIVKFNPIKSSARAPGDKIPRKLPMFAEALSPEEWIAFHNINVTNGVSDREATRRAFLQQLGPRWNSIDSCPLYMQALFAAFALKGVQKREHSDELLGRIALCWSEKGGLKLTSAVTSEIKKILRDKEIGGHAEEIAALHAYRTTALLSVLKWARSMGGVLSPSQFLWLRGLDRALWYPLNNLGRRSFHSEGAGSIAHFMAEENAKKALAIPRIDTAIVTLNQYLANSSMPIPPRE